MLINYFVFLREDFELHPLEMKPNVIEIKMSNDSNYIWNIDIGRYSVSKKKKKSPNEKMESWSSEFSMWEVKEIKQDSNEITCLGWGHFL